MQQNIELYFDRQASLVINTLQRALITNSVCYFLSSAVQAAVSQTNYTETGDRRSHSIERCSTDLNALPLRIDTLQIALKSVSSDAYSLTHHVPT